MTDNIFQPQAIAHLQPAIWEKVTRLHISKIIAELAHEGILQPALQSEKDGWGYYSLSGAREGAALLGSHGSSYLNRAMAIYRHLAGLPGDQGPPAAP